jgi:hypothetical protein
MVSPPAALETPRTQSRFLFSLSAERPESEKQRPWRQNAQNSRGLIPLRLQKHERYANQKINSSALSASLPSNERQTRSRQNGRFSDPGSSRPSFSAILAEWKVGFRFIAARKLVSCHSCRVNVRKKLRVLKVGFYTTGYKIKPAEFTESAERYLNDIFK